MLIDGLKRKCYSDKEMIIINEKNNKNIVTLSEEKYNNLMENIYVLGNEANYDWLMESKEQLETGKFFAHNLDKEDIS